MNRSLSHTQCALCRTQLSWWNASTCALCGKTTCRQHTHLVKRAHSCVLASVCGGCAGLHHETQLVVNGARQTVEKRQPVVVR